MQPDTIDNWYLCFKCWKILHNILLSKCCSFQLEVFYSHETCLKIYSCI